MEGESCSAVLGVAAVATTLWAWKTLSFVWCAAGGSCMSPIDIHGVDGLPSTWARAPCVHVCVCLSIRVQCLTVEPAAIEDTDCHSVSPLSHLFTSPSLFSVARPHFVENRIKTRCFSLR